MAQIASIGYYLPKQVFSNDDLLKRISESCDDNIVEKLKTRLINNKAIKRHFLSPGETHLDLAVTAAENCLKKINFRPEDLDLIIYSGFLKDYLEPASSIFIQNKLGAYNAFCFDIANACNGFLTAMDQANILIEAGTYQNILIVTGEASYRYIPWEKFSNDPNTGFSALTVSDGAGAMLIQKGGWEKNFKLRDFKTFGQYHEYCQVHNDDLKMNVKSRDMAIVAIKIMSQFIPSFLGKAEELLGGIDIWFLHQTTGEPRGYLGDTSDDMYSKYYNSFPVVGNTATASLPLGMALAEEEGKLKKGDKVVCLIGASGFTCGGLAFVY